MKTIRRTFKRKSITMLVINYETNKVENRTIHIFSTESRRIKELFARVFPECGFIKTISVKDWKSTHEMLYTDFLRLSGHYTENSILQYPREKHITSNGHKLPAQVFITYANLIKEEELQ